MLFKMTQFKFPVETRINRYYSFLAGCKLIQLVKLASQWRDGSKPLSMARGAHLLLQHLPVKYETNDDDDLMK